MPEPSAEVVEALFQQAADLSPSSRGAILDEQCGTDHDLRAAVEELLRFDAKAKNAPDFLHSPADDLRAALPLWAAAMKPSFGRYRILRLHGEGGMGTVYEAEQDNPRRTVALKVIRPGLVSPELIKRFGHEAQILARVQHPGIAQVYDAGMSEDGRPFFAMEFIHGMPLDEYARGRGLGAGARLELVAMVCDAVQHAHHKGVIHRDLKPGNILVDESGQPKVLDFGVAHVTAADLVTTASQTQTGQLLGTLSYMSPEQIAPNPAGLDGRSDVYTLGVILFELLALRLPYHVDQLPVHEVARVIQQEEPSRLGSINALYRGDVEIIVAKALEKDRARRYHSAGDLASDIRRYLRGEPIRARQVSSAERYWRWARRNPVIAVLGGALTVVLIVVAVGSTLAASYFRSLAGVAIEARQRAILERDKAQRNEKAERWARYRSTIAVASAAVQLQDSTTARSALEAAPEEHRNWEWQHFHSQLDGARHVWPVPGGGAAVLLALSPSGQQAAVGCADRKAVYLYDVAAGKPGVVLRGHSADVVSVAYRPDGKQVATSGDGTIRLWDPATGRELAVLRGEGPLFPLWFSPDGSRIAALDGNKSRLWDASACKEIAVLGELKRDAYSMGGELVFSPDSKQVAVASGEYVRVCDAGRGGQLAVLGPHEARVSRLACSRDGKRIASSTGVARCVIHLWNRETGKEVAILRGHTAAITHLLFSPDPGAPGRLLSCANYPDTAARLWDAATGRLLAVLAGHRNTITGLALTPDGNRVLTASADQTARLWDAVTGQLLAVLGGHTGVMRYGFFSPDGTRVVTASDDATLRLCDARTGELIGVLRGHGDRFSSLPVFTPDGSRLVSGSNDGTVRIWDVSLVERNGILRGHESFVYDVAFSPDGKQVASSAWDSTARLWDATTGRQTGLLKHETAIIGAMAYSRDGRRLATVERDRGITLWDVPSQKVVRTWRAPAGSWRFDTRAALNPAGTLLAAGSPEGPVRLWDVNSGQEITQLKGHEKGSVDIAFHPDGHQLAAAGEDGTVRIWDVATHANQAILRGHTDGVWRVAFSADGKLLASGSTDKTVRLWDTETYTEIAVVAIAAAVYGLAFSPDPGAPGRLAAGCADNTVRLIDVATHQEVAELRGHSAYVHAVAWSPDSTRLVSASGDRTVRVWDALSPADRAQRPDASQTPR